MISYRMRLCALLGNVCTSAIALTSMENKKRRRQKFMYFYVLAVVVVVDDAAAAVILLSTHSSYRIVSYY